MKPIAYNYKKAEEQIERLTKLVAKLIIDNEMLRAEVRELRNDNRRLKQ